MYAIRQNRVYKAELIKPTKSGTAWWCRLDGGKKYYLVSNSKLYENFIQALSKLKVNHSM